MTNVSGPRVFVIQDDGSKDLTDAKRFGSLVPVLSGDVFPDNAEERVQIMRDIIHSKFRTFNPDTDHILLVGDPAAILAVGLYLGCMFAETGDEIRALKYDREARGYYSVEI